MNVKVLIKNQDPPLVRWNAGVRCFTQANGTRSAGGEVPGDAGIDVSLQSAERLVQNTEAHNCDGGDNEGKAGGDMPRAKDDAGVDYLRVP